MNKLLNFVKNSKLKLRILFLLLYVKLLCHYFGTILQRVEYVPLSKNEFEIKFF